MTPELLAWAKWMSLAPLMTGLMAWLGSDHGEEEADEIAQANRLVLDTLSDADEVRGIEVWTEHNLRDQMTVQDAERLYEEAGEAEQQRRGWWN